jgi:manganese transport protein
MFAVWLGGDGATGRLLILSQVILSLTLPFAVVPLVLFTASKRWMGEFSASRVTTTLAGIIAVILILLNGKLVYDAIAG